MGIQSLRSVLFIRLEGDSFDAPVEGGITERIVNEHNYQVF